MDTSQYLVIFFQILGSLALLIYGMKVMSEALQKMAGSQLRHILGAMTTNRFTGMLTGTFITCAVQSSSATTVMTVSFVNAGLLTLAQAISVIMGANIGTTFTAWIMSLGYNVDLTIVVFPAFFLGIMLIYSKKRRYFGDFLFGIAFLFFSLVLLSSAGKALDLEHNPAVIDFFGSFDTKSHFTIVVFLLIGTLITCIVQSSAAVMAITILLCSTGVLPIYLGIALVMGENIGTTATANLAALGANAQARRAALAHLVFNVFGVIWVLCLFYPELSVFEAQQEIGSFGERIHRMFGMVRELLETQDSKTFDKLYERIEKYEGISDNMEIEIAKYLDQVSDAHLSDDTKAKIRAMLREISEIESIGDSCFNLARTIKRKGENKEEFTAKQSENIHQMFKLVDEALTQMNYMFAHERHSINLNHTYNVETEINNYRTQLRNQNLDDVDNHLYTYGVGTLYMDIIQECEKLGDYVVNVAEARMGVRTSEAV